MKKGTPGKHERKLNLINMTSTQRRSCQKRFMADEMDSMKNGKERRMGRGWLFGRAKRHFHTFDAFFHEFDTFLVFFIKGELGTLLAPRWLTKQWRWGKKKYIQNPFECACDTHSTRKHSMHDVLSGRSIPSAYSQLTLSEGRGTPWTARQPITAHVGTDNHSQSIFTPTDDLEPGCPIPVLSF